MKRHHKWFRKERYKQKLEAKAGTQRTYWSHIKFLTDEPDMEDFKRERVRLWWVYGNMTDEEAFEYYRDWNMTRNHNNYEYYERPTVPYTIHKVHTPPKRSKTKVEYQKYSNKLVRQAWKQRGEIYQHCQYKKLFGIAWELD